MFWENEPIKLNNNEEINLITTDILTSNIEMPDGLKIKTLGLKYLEEIHSLINNHYTEDQQKTVRLTFSKDFIYWYLIYAPPEFIIGLVLNKKIVGLITALFIDMVIYDKEIKVPYINFLCLHSKIRNMGITFFLINEMKSRLLKNNITYGLFCTTRIPADTYCTIKEFIIPLNYSKLKEVGFLTETYLPIPKLHYNSFHLMAESDIDSVVIELNNFLAKFKVRPYFTNDSAHHFLLPKRNVVYSFVKKNTENDVTDFVTIYKKYLYCLDKNKIISVAKLAFYYYSTMNLTELIVHLIDKLLSYNFDQLLFSDMGENINIDITKFSTFDEFNYYFYNLCIKKTNPSLHCMFPI